MKRIRMSILLAITWLLLLGMTNSVSAATVNPLKNMPTSYKAVLGGEGGKYTGYETPVFKTPVKISVTSSNSKIVKVYKYEQYRRQADHFTAPDGTEYNYPKGYYASSFMTLLTYDSSRK